MQMIRMGAATLLLSLTACKGFPFFIKSGEKTSHETPAGDQPPPQALLELQNSAFDGETLSGRFIVGVKQGKLTLDRRLIENVSLQVRSVSDCTTGQPVSFLMADSFPEPPRDDDIITLSPGQWYGSTVHFLLFDKELTQQTPPSCFEAEFWLKTADGKVAGRLRTRAVSAATTPHGCAADSMDAGCTPPAPDASAQPREGGAQDAVFPH